MEGEEARERGGEGQGRRGRRNQNALDDLFVDSCDRFDLP